MRRYRGRHRRHWCDWDSMPMDDTVAPGAGYIPDVFSCLRDCTVCGACPTGEHDRKVAAS